MRMNKPSQGDSDAVPRLAVVVTCWNYEEYVGRAIESVFVQARPDIELIVVDDGSTDGSWAVIEASGAQAVRTANAGARAACIVGLARTTAPFILFLDADDELKPGALDTILPLLDERVAKLQFPLERIGPDGEQLGSVFPTLSAGRDCGAIARQILRSGTYPTPPTSGNVFRRDVCSLLAEATYESWADGILLLAAPFFGDVVTVAEPLALYRIHDRNDSGSGREPKPGNLKRDLDRFEAQLDHLRELLRPLGLAHQLIDPRRAFVYLERSLALAVVSERRPSPLLCARFLARTLQDRFPPASATAFAVLAVGSLLLPSPMARRLLAYRFSLGDRSALGLLRATFMP